MKSAFLLLFLLCHLCNAQVHFDGATNYIDCGTYEKSPPFTFAAWIFAEEINSTDNIIMGEQYNRQFDFNNGTELRLYDDFFNPKSFVFPIQSNDILNVWTHVGVTASATNVCLYINGTAVTNNALLAYSGGVTSVYIGAGNYLGNMVRHFDGAIDDARAYTRVLSPAEFAELYAKPWVLSDDPDLVLRTSIPDPWNEALMSDISGNGHTSTNHGVILSETSAGWAGTFDGVDDYVSASLSNPFGIGDYTIFFVADMHDNPSFRICPAINTTTAMTFPYICLYTNMITVQRDAAGSYKLESHSATGRTAYCYGRESGVVFLYVNGQKKTLTGSGANYDQNGYSFNSASFTINRFYYNSTEYFYAGELFDMALYDHALTSNDIATLSENSSITNVPLAQWTMQPARQDTGSTLSGVAQNYGSGADCTYINGPTVAPGMIRHSEPRHRVTSQRLEFNTDLIRDMSGNGHAATNHGVYLHETAQGWAGVFSSTDADYTCTSMDNTISSNCTAIVWFRTTEWSSLTGGMLLYTSRDYADSLYRRFFLQPTDYGGPAGTYYFQVQTTGASSGQNTSGLFTFADYTDYCVAGVLRNGNTLELYIDGVLKKSGAVPTSYIINNESTIGAGASGTQPSDCEMYEVQWYPTTALSSNDIYTLFTEGIIVDQPEAKWTFQPECRTDGS